MEDNLDDILESALEDLEQEEQRRNATAAKPRTNTSNTSSTNISNTNTSNTNTNTKTSNNTSNNNTSASNSGSEMPDFMKEVDKLRDSLSFAESDEDFEQKMHDLVRQFQNFAPADGSTDPVEEFGMPDLSNLGEADLQNVMQAFQAPGIRDALQDVMNNMMKKEVLYEPMVQMRDLYPQFLKDNKDKLEAAEFERFSTQFEIITAICKEYETKNDVATVVALMDQMQANGQPPPEIVKKLAPSLPTGGDALPGFGEDAKNCVIQWQ